jgi:hypothetical protein
MVSENTVEWMEAEELRVNRWKVGLLALGLLIGAVVAYLIVPDRQGLVGALLRVGVLLGTFWLAIPQLIQHPRLLKFLPWYLLLGVVLVVVFIRYLFVMIPLFIALAILSMFSGKRPKNRVSSRQAHQANSSADDPPREPVSPGE